MSIPHNQAQEKPRPSPNVLSPFVLTSQALVPICIQPLSSALRRYLLCVLGSVIVGVRLHMYSRTHLNALVPFDKDSFSLAWNFARWLLNFQG